MKATDSRLKSIFKKNASAFRRDGSRAKLRDNQKFETALLASRYDVSFTNHQLTTQSSKGQNSLDHQVNRRKSRANLPLSAQAASFMSAGRNPTFQRLGPDMVLQYRTAALSMLNLARDPRVVFDKGTLRRLSLLGTVPDAAVRLHCARAFYLLALRPAVRAAIVQVQSVRYLINNVFRAGSTDPGLALCVAGALCFLTCEDGQEEALIDQGLLHGIQKLMALASGAASGGGGGGAGGEGSAASAGGSGHHPADTQAAFMAVITRYCATAVFNVCCAQSLTVTHVPNLVDIILRTAETAKSPAAAGAATAAAAAAAAAGGAGDAASAAGEGGGVGGGSAAGLSNGASPRPSASLAPSALGALPRKTQECSGRTFHRLMALRALCNLSERFCDAVLENRGFKVATAAGHGHGGGEEPSEILEAVVATICNAAIQLAGPLRARMIQGEQCVERANALAAVRGQMARQPRRVQELLSMTYRKLARDEGSWGALLGKGVLGALRRLAPLPAAEVRLNVAHALASLVQSREAHGPALVKDATAALHSLVSKPESDPAEEKNELPPELDNAAGVGVLSIKISSGLLATEPVRRLLPAEVHFAERRPPAQAAGGGGGGQGGGGGGGGGGPRSPKTRRSAAAGPAAESDARAAAAAAALGVKQLCATVMSLLQTAPEMVHALIENKAFELLEKILDDVDLSSPKGLEIGEICCRVIYNCCCCNSLRLQDYMTDGIFGFLLKTISEGSLQSKELASGALWRFMHIAGDAEVEMGKVNRIVQVLDQALHEYEQSPPRGGGGGGRRGSRPPGGGGGGGDADDQAKHAIKSNVLGTVCAIVRYHFGRMTLESKKRIAAEMITFCRSEDQPVTLANVASVLCVLSQSNIESGGELFGDDLIARDLLPAIMKPMSVAGRPQVILLCVITLANMAKDRRLAMLIVHGRGNFNPQKQGFEGFLQSMVKSSLSYGGQDNLKLGVASILATLSQYDCELELMKQGLATEIMALGLLHDTRNRTSAANKRLCALMLHNIVTALLPGPNHSIGASQEDHMGAALRDSKSFAWALCNLAESEEEATRQMSLAALANLSALPPFLRGLCHTDHAVRALRGVCARPDCAPATRRAVANLVCNMCHHEEGIVHLDGTDKKPEDSIVHTLLDNLQVGMEENDIELQTVTAQAVCALAYVGCETSRGVFLRAILKICQVVEANPSQALVKAVAMAMTATAYYSPRALVQDGEGEPLVQPFFAALRLVLGLRGCGLDHRDFCISVLHHLTAEEANLPHLIDYGALELMQEVIEGELRKGGVFSAALVNWCVELMHNLAAGRERAAKMVSMGVCAFVASVLAQPNATAHTVQIAGQFVSNLCRAKINTNRLCRDHAFHILQQWVQISDAEDTNISASIAIRKLVQAIGNHEIADKANVLGMTMAIFRRCASAAAATHCAATLARLAVNARLAPRFRALGVAAEIRRMALAPDRLPPPAKRFCLAALCTLSRYEEEHTMPSKKKEMPSKLKIIASRDDDESDNDDDQKEQASQKSSAEELAGIASSIMNLVFTEADDQGPQGSRADEISHIVSMLQDLEKQETDHELKQKQGVLESLLSMQSGASSSDKSKWTAPTYSISRRESTKSVKERAISLSRMLHEEDLGLSGNFQNDDANKFSSEDFGIEQLPPPTPFRHEKYFVEEGTFENDLAALGTLSFEPALAPRALPPGKLRQLLADGGGGGGGGGGTAHHPHRGGGGGGGGGQQAAARYLTTYPKHMPGQDDVMDEQMLSSRLEDYEDDRKLSMLLQQSRPHTSPAPAQDPRFRDDSLSSALSATSVLSDFQTGFARNKSASHFKQLIQMLDTQHTDLDGAESPPTTMIDDNDKRNSILGQTDLSHRRSWIKFPGGGGGAAVGGAGGDGGGNLPPLGAAAAAAAPRRSIFEQAAARHARHHPEHADTFEDNDAAAAAVAAAVGSPLRAGAGALEKTASAKKKDFGRGGKRTSTVSFKLDPDEEGAPVHDRPSIEGLGLYSVGNIFMNKVAETQRQQQQQQQQQGTRRAPPSSAHGGARGAAAAAAAARRGSARRATALRRGEEGGAAAAEGGRAAAAPGDLGSGHLQQDRPASSKLSAATERRKKHVTAAILMNRKHNRILRGQGVQPSDQRAKAAYQRPPPPGAARARFSATAPAGLGRPGATGGGGGGGQVGRRRREEEEAAARLAAEIFERGGPPRAFASPLADYRAKYTYELDLEGPLTRARKEERRKLKKKLLGNKSAGDIEEGRASMATAGTAIQNQRASFTGQPSSNTWTETALAPQAIAFVQHSGSRMSGGIGVRVAPPQYGEKDDSLTSLTNPTKNEKNRRNSLR